VNGARQTPWSVRFRRERERAWRDLERLVTRVERSGIDGLGAEELARLPVLYRAVLSALEVARSSVADRVLTEYLHALAARAYLVVYAPKRRIGQVVGQFVTVGFPEAVRAIGWHIAVAAGVLLIGTAIAWAMVAADAENYWLFVDASMSQGRDPLASTEELRKTLFGGGEHANLLTFAVFLFTHNSSVGILVYGLGFAFGLPVVLLLFYNGMMLGAMSALFHERGLAVEWWSWILPHGGTELTAIVLCGAAGLAVGHRLVFPGRSSRLHGLASAGRRMGAVVAGSIGMLFLAGIIEGVFRQVITDVPTRYVLASVLGAAWVAYFLRAGRRR
jgi:uncharacterized membrane protein SpoIIM required for sporulation